MAQDKVEWKIRKRKLDISDRNESWILEENLCEEVGRVIFSRVMPDVGLVRCSIMKENVFISC
jgi:hypothetical protein